jgi:hypothetical protein
MRLQAASTKLQGNMPLHGSGHALPDCPGMKGKIGIEATAEPLHLLLHPARCISITVRGNPESGCQYSGSAS